MRIKRFPGGGSAVMASPAPVRPLRIVMAKVGLDGHDRGVKVVARALRDAGYEVIYTGLRQTPEMVVEAALQEDAQVIGLSLHSGAHMTLFPAVVSELQRRDAADIVVFGGGIIPDDDIVELKRQGVAELFTPGTPLQHIVDWLRQRFPEGPSGPADSGA
jgi:methylmalonyl-CoA mutase C-terminal domain/subunit